MCCVGPVWFGADMLCPPWLRVWPPLPAGEGGGEGPHDSRSKAPHPNPLPSGEGKGARGWIIPPLTLTDRRAMIRRPAVWQHASVPPYVTCTGKGRQFNGAPLPTQSQGDRVLMQIPSPAVQESLTWLTDSLDQVLD